MPDGSLHVFITHNFNIMHLAGEPLQEQTTVIGANVPFPILIDGQLFLIAQAAIGRTREPVIVPFPLDNIGEDHVEPDWQPMIPQDALAGIESCTSPVMAPSPAETGGWILLCVEERIDCSDPDSLDRYDHCKGLEVDEDAPEPTPHTPPEPGAKGPPQPIDCGYPDAAETDPRCRGADDCSSPEAKLKFLNCQQ
jgi:hypothetical protein